MLDYTHFGNKLRSHRKKLGLTQEEVAKTIGVSPQAISKWEAGDCLPDCYNLKAICQAYALSADILLETEKDGDLASVTSKIEQLATEFVWSDANTERYNQNLRKELGNDLWEMWKVIYFTEIGDRKLQQESKAKGNLRIIGSYGAKVCTSRYKGSPLLPGSFVRSSTAMRLTVLGITAARYLTENGRYRCTLTKPTFSPLSVM